MVSDEELEKAYVQIARIVSIYGEIYLPIFEQIEKEVNERKLKSEAMKRAFVIAESHPGGRKSVTPTDTHTGIHFPPKINM